MTNVNLITATIMNVLYYDKNLKIAEKTSQKHENIQNLQKT